MNVQPKFCPEQLWPPLVSWSVAWDNTVYCPPPFFLSDRLTQTFMDLKEKIASP